MAHYPPFEFKIDRIKKYSPLYIYAHKMETFVVKTYIISRISTSNQ